MKPIVLLIAYYFPPDSAIGGARPYRFYKYLKRLGYECHVITAADGEVAPDVHRVADPLKTHPKQGLAWQMERVTWKFLYRGMTVWGWSSAAIQEGRKFLAERKGKSVVILSTSPPLGTHAAASNLAREFGRAWIADFRDPIYGPGGDRAPFEKIFAPRIERKFLAKAGMVLANTDAVRDLWVARDPALKEKIQVLWNGFDPEDAIHPEALPARDAKVWSHVGELYGGRDIRPLLYAVERLRRDGRLPEQLKIQQVGVAEAECLPDADFLRKATKAGWLEMRDAVPAAQARRAALDSDGLWLIQPQSAVQVPGKLFEYLRMGRPIFAYVVRDSPVERILRQAGVPYECAYPESGGAEIEARLVSFWGKLRGEPYAPNSWFYSTFEASRQAETLAGIIDGQRGVS